LSSLLKGGWVELNNDEKRVIDPNHLVARRLGKISQPVREGSRMEMGEPDADGFAGGFDAEILDGSEGSGVIKGSPVETEPTCEELQRQAEELFESAKREVENAWQEAESIKAKAHAAAQEAALNVRNEARREGLEQGYEEGTRKAEAEAAAKFAELEERARQLEADYDARLQQLEPLFIDNLTSIYEHIFHVELSGYREILSYLITTTMRKTEGSREFFIHVSKEDYPYVSTQKKQLAAAAENCMVEVVEDVTLSKGGCMIETENGVFDCGIDTQLSQLSTRLKILSYE